MVIYTYISVYYIDMYIYIYDYMCINIYIYIIIYLLSSLEVHFQEEP